MLQNPTDPDATFRKKAGKGFRGYSGSFLQMTISFVPDNKDENTTVYPTIVLRNRVDQNNTSDSDACEKSLRLFRSSRCPGTCMPMGLILASL